MNYKADRTPFWNQFFIAALRDAEGTIVNHVGVQCEVRIADGEEVKRGVRVNPLGTWYKPPSLNPLLLYVKPAPVSSHMALGWLIQTMVG